MGAEPHPVTSSARRRWAVPNRWLAACVLAAASALPVAAQILPDSTAASAVADTVQGAPDSLAAAAQDSLPSDTIFYNLPALASGAPAGFSTGVWEWDREAILVSAASTLGELVGDLPGVIELLGGDYGAPASLSAFGSGAGGVRVIRDGFEVTPLEGGVADLQRIGLGGIVSVRLERRGGEILIELTSYRYDDGRPFSLVEAGTGQFATNIFRGTFADPTSLGGSVALALERVDTRSYGSDAGGNRTGTWLRYQLHSGDRAGLALDYRRMSSKTEVPDYATSVRRSDLTLRGRFEIVEGLVAEAYTGKSSHTVDDAREAYDYEGGSRNQHGVRLDARRDGAWARGAFRLHTSDALPARRIEGSGGYTGARLGAYGNVSQAAWDGTSVLGYGLGGWLGPLAGLRLFASWDGGAYAGPSGPLLDELPDPGLPPLALPTSPPGPTATITERSLLRAGASASLFGVTVAGAGLRSDADFHRPLGLELDRGAPSVPGAERYGVEGWASLPMPLEGLRLEGSYQQWDSGGPYLPRRIYRGAFVFHRVYLESGNFELWWSLGVRGHDPMSVFLAPDGAGGAGGLGTVPFYQNWYGRVQARILTVRLFLTWENFTIRRNLQNFPGRLLPPTRSFFGLRWDLWN